MSQDCRRIWENLPAILTYRNFQYAVQVIFVSVSGSKRKGKYNFKPSFKISSTKPLIHPMSFSLAGNSKPILLCMENGARNWKCSRQAVQQLHHCDTITEYKSRREDDWWQWPGSANSPVNASHILSDNSGLTHGQEAKSVRPGQGQWGAMPGIGRAATKLSHGHRSRAWAQYSFQKKRKETIGKTPSSDSHSLYFHSNLIPCYTGEQNQSWFWTWPNS